MRYKVGDQGYTEYGLSWAEAIALAEEWYYTGAWDRRLEEAVADLGPADLGMPEDGDVEGVQRALDRYMDTLAESVGHTPWYGHGSYAVSSASEAGLSLMIEEDD